MPGVSGGSKWVDTPPMDFGRSLFLVMSTILRCSPANEPMYQFMDKKRAEDKPYGVYMMASANKFLRIYYASVKRYLDSLEA